MDAMTGSKIILPKVRGDTVSFREVIFSTTLSDPVRPLHCFRALLFLTDYFLQEKLRIGLQNINYFELGSLFCAASMALRYLYDRRLIKLALISDGRSVC